MCNAIWQPPHNVESGGLVRRENLAEVCAVHDVFERRKYANPDWGSVINR